MAIALKANATTFEIVKKVNFVVGMMKPCGSAAGLGGGIFFSDAGTDGPWAAGGIMFQNEYFTDIRDITSYSHEIGWYSHEIGWYSLALALSFSGLLCMCVSPRLNEC